MNWRVVEERLVSEGKEQIEEKERARLRDEEKHDCPSGEYSVNALGDVAGMTQTGPRKHHTKGLWPCGEGLQIFEKMFVSGGEQNDGCEYVVGQEDLTNPRGALRVGGSVEKKENWEHYM